MNRRTLVAATALVAASFFATPPASAQSLDGQDRRVTIINSSGQSVRGIYARPLSGPTRISGDRIPNNTISPGFQQTINFDDGFGACLYSVRATGSSGRDWVWTMDVCSVSEWRLTN
mgnify:CR=1 FL=1